MSRRAAAIRRERERVERVGRRERRESWAVRTLEGKIWGVSGESVAVERRNDVKTLETDFVR